MTLGVFVGSLEKLAQKHRDRRAKMKKFAMLGVLVAMVTVGAHAKELELKKKAGDMEVKLTLKQNPPIVGDNDAIVEIKDSTGKPVTDAKVVVNYSMPPMPGMAPMNYKTDAMLHGDKYHARMNLSMAGPWNIEVKITRGGKTASAKFNVDAK
jgi:hypothetical protein